LLKESIQYSLDNRENALQYAIQLARDMDSALVNRFVATWVNGLTRNYCDCVREGVRRLLSEGHQRGMIPHAVSPQFLE